MSGVATCFGNQRLIAGTVLRRGVDCFCLRHLRGSGILSREVRSCIFFSERVSNDPEGQTS